MHLRGTLLALTLSLSATVLGAQPTDFEVPTTNPKAVVQQRLGATEVEVGYSRPSVRNREIFGALVPFDHVWRTGADASTKISFSTPVSVEGQKVAAGTYELFTIPGRARWAVILQESRSQWGSYAYDPTHDVVRVEVEPQTLARTVESFTIAFDAVGRSEATMLIAWAKTLVPVHLSVDLEKTVVPPLEAALAAEGKRPYFQAAMFYYETGLDLARAEELMETALEPNPGHVGMLYRLALIRDAQGNQTGAIEAAERSLEAAQSGPRELQEEYQRLNTALLARLRCE